MAIIIQPKRRFWHSVVRWAASQRMVAGIAAHILHRLDIRVVRMSRGRYTAAGWLAGLPMITLTAVGAKSGQPRSVPLAGIPDGENVILIASNWGQKKHPSWYYNVRANPEVTVAVNGQSQAFVARELDGDEREKGWDTAVGIYAGYNAYKSRTGGRKIPVMLLEPKPGE